jgi:hypothetical protein
MAELLQFLIYLGLLLTIPVAVCSAVIMWKIFQIIQNSDKHKTEELKRMNEVRRKIEELINELKK